MTFSIVITSYDQRDFIVDAVNSALSLRKTDREIIVVDDASTDGSQDILSKYGDAICFVSLEINHGKGAARNCGASMATGDYLVFLDGDDVFLPWGLDVYARVVQATHPKLILSPMLWFRGTLPSVPPTDAPHAIEIVEYEDYFRKDRSFGVSASSIVIDRQAFQSVQGWATEKFVMQDQDLVIRLGDSGRTTHILSPPTTLHRAHPGQTVNYVPPFLNVLHKMIRKETLGQYPGGRRRRFERLAILGGLVFFWTKRAFKAGLYWDAAKLLAHGWLLALVAMIHRASVIVKRRQPCKTIDL